MKSIISTKAVWPSNLDSEKPEGSQLVLVATFAIPAMLVVAILVLLITFRGGIENSVANLALLLPVGYAFAAGMVASVNPCGVMMLTSYAFFQSRGERQDAPAVGRALKALLVAVVVTLGFILIFAVVGAIISAGGQWLVASFPYAGLLIGVGMVALGAWLLLARKTLGILAVKGMTVEPQHNMGNAFLFGITYAIASLSCTLPIFLVVVGSALSSEGAASSFAQFIGYSLGMGAIILVVTVGAALFRRAMARWLRALTPYIHRLSAVFLIGAGLYLIYYWVFQGGLAA